MTQDPFANLPEQLHTYELFEQHKAALLDDARKLLGERPELEVVGVILEFGAPEGATLFAALEKASGQKFQGRGFIGLMPREMLVDVLRKNSPAHLEWLPSPEAGAPRRLAIAAFTKAGVQIANFPLDAEALG